MSPSAAPIYDDKLVRLYQGSAEEIVPTFESGTFDLVVYDPPRSGRYAGYASPMARLLHEKARDWIVTFVANAREQRKWKGDKVAVHLPLFWSPRWSREERLVICPMQKVELPRVAPPVLWPHPEAPPEWCPAARHSELYHWLYLLLQPKSVLDPFSGSGNALLEARKLGIPATGIEVKPERAYKIRERLART